MNEQINSILSKAKASLEAAEVQVNHAIDWAKEFLEAAMVYLSGLEQ